MRFKYMEAQVYFSAAALSPAPPHAWLWVCGPTETNNCYNLSHQLMVSNIVVYKLSQTCEGVGDQIYIYIYIYIDMNITAAFGQRQRCGA